MKKNSHGIGFVSSKEMLRSPTSLGSCESSQYGVREGWPMVGLMQFDTCIDIQEVKIYFDL